jgi:hypothetical protein
MSEHTFGHFLKKFGMVAPNMMGPEFEEEYLVKEELEARRDKAKPFYDHVEDKTCFEIAIVNKANMAL